MTAVLRLCLLLACTLGAAGALFDFTGDGLGKSSASPSADTCWVKSTSLPVLYHNLNAKLMEDTQETTFTSHICSGSFAENRACRFRNLYFNTQINEFEYFVCKDEAPRSVAWGHHFGIEDFTQPEVSVDSHLGPSFIGYVLGYGAEDRYPIHKVYSCPPAEGTYVKTFKGLSVIWPGHMIYRFGHMWVDNFYPLFMTLAAFEAVTHDFALVLLRQSDSKKLEGFHNYWRGMSSQPAQFLPYMSLKSNKKYIKFEDVLIGNQQWSLTPVIHDNHDTAIGPTHSTGYYWRDMRAHYLTGLGLNPKVKLHKHRVVLNVGLEKRDIANPQETQRCLQEHFPGLDVRPVTFHTMTVEEQMKLLQETSVLVSTEGSPGFRMVFMPPGATAIMLSAPFGEGAPDKKVSAFHEADRFLDAIADTQILRYPVRFKDTDEYTVRYDREVNESLGGATREKSYWDVWRYYDADIVIKCEKLVPYITQALIDTTAAVLAGRSAA